MSGYRTTPDLGIDPVTVSLIVQGVMTGAKIGLSFLREHRLEERRRVKREVEAWMKQARQDMQALRERLQQNMTAEGARQVLDTNAQTQRQQALDRWQRRAKDLPSSLTPETREEAARQVADAVQQTYLTVAAQKSGLTGVFGSLLPESTIGKIGVGAGAIGAGLGLWSFLR